MRPFLPDPELIAVARGDAPADLVITGGRLANVFTGELEETEIAIYGDRIAGVGSGLEGNAHLDADGAIVAPGLIDAHVHVESSMVPPSEMVKAVAPRGTTTLISDPHEIANVAGLDGIRWMLEDARGLPVEVLVNLSSCVPASHMETSGAQLEIADLLELIDDPGVLGLAEVMNFPGVVFGAEPLLAKIEAFAHLRRPIDGHCPGLRGRQLDAYIAAGIGSDHEAVALEEAREKLAKGLVIFIREATNARNLDALLPLVNAATERRICLCTDDRQPSDLIEVGGIDHMLRRAVASGLEPMTALRLATLNPAEHFGLDRGAIAPGRRADIALFTDLESFSTRTVIAGGRIVAESGRWLLADAPLAEGAPRDTLRVDLDAVDLRIPARGRTIRAIGAREGQLITDCVEISARIVDGEAIADPDRDLAKMAVIERHGINGQVGLGFVTGLGLARGAIATTVAHDHHNLVVIGCDDLSMRSAAQAVIATGGGQAAALGEETLACLPLPIAGLMSDLSIGRVAASMNGLIHAAHELGSSVHDPFMAAAFLALEVIPELKLTDCGLVDVKAFEIVDLWLD